MPRCSCSIGSLFDEIRETTRSMAREAGVEVSFERFYESLAAPTATALRDMIENAAAALELPSMRMPSGAGHDAQEMAGLAPIGMIFVPSVGGISHSPKEHTRPQDLINGASVLLLTLLKIDREPWRRE